MAQQRRGTPVLHHGSSVRCQFTVDGTHYNLVGFVRGKVEGDPDKVRVDIICPVTSSEDLLESPITFARVLQHGDEGEHATFRYANE